MTPNLNERKIPASFYGKTMDTAIETGIIITGTTVGRLGCLLSRTNPRSFLLVEGVCLIFIIPNSLGNT
jgi:hypothetical protein